MSFPYHDRAWLEAVGVLLSQLRDDDRVLAPDRFWWALPVPVQRWVSENLDGEKTFDLVVVHKGELSWVPRRPVERLADELRPVFANEVFVLLATPDRVAVPFDEDSPHLRSFREIVRGLSETPLVDNPYELDMAIGAAPVLTRFDDLSDAELRASQDTFFAGGGYQYPTDQDHVYHQAMIARSTEALARWPGSLILDIACGSLSLVPVPTGTRVVRTDLSPTGTAQARDADDSHEQFAYASVDGRDLAFADESFDAVTIIDAIEHIRDTERLFAESARVLRPGGELYVTYANSNSLNQIVMGALGYPPFVTNHQHLHEFDADEIDGLLAGAGFEVVATAGVDFRPYWGVPGIDEAVRKVTDGDPVVAEAMGEIGRLVGHRYAYTGIVTARKQG